MYNVIPKKEVKVYYVLVEDTQQLIKVYAESSRVVERAFKDKGIKMWLDDLVETRLLPIE